MLVDSLLFEYVCVCVCCVTVSLWLLCLCPAQHAVKAGEQKDSYFFQTQFKPLCGSINLAYRIAAHFLMVNETLNINN